MKKTKKILISSVSIVLFFLIWEIVTRIGLLDKHFVTPFSDVLLNTIKLFKTGEIFPHLLASMKRVFFGFTLSVVIGVPLGFILGWSKKFSKFLNPLLQMLGQTSPFALFPVFIAIFGIGEFSKVAIIFWACLWQVLINTTQGVKSTDPLLLKGIRSMGASQFKILKDVVLPSSLPSVFTGLKLAASSSIIMLSAAEMMGASEGIGYLILFAQQTFKIPTMYTCIILLAIIGILFCKILNIIEKKLRSWDVTVNGNNNVKI